MGQKRDKQTTALENMCMHVSYVCEKCGWVKMKERLSRNCYKLIQKSKTKCDLVNLPHS